MSSEREINITLQLQSRRTAELLFTWKINNNTEEAKTTKQKTSGKTHVWSGFNFLSRSLTLFTLFFCIQFIASLFYCTWFMCYMCLLNRICEHRYMCLYKYLSSNGISFCHLGFAGWTPSIDRRFVKIMIVWESFNRMKFDSWKICLAKDFSSTGVASTLHIHAVLKASSETVKTRRTISVRCVHRITLRFQ